MATNLDNLFLTIDVIDRGSNRVLYSQEIPNSMVGRFAVLFGYNSLIANIYAYRIKTKDGTVVKEF